jgi:uncharacterized tellurite resistance protein B-like protein
MLRTLKDLFNTLLPPEGTATGAGPLAGDATHRLQLATAVLLVEVMRSDADMGEAERRSVMQALRRTFRLQDDELDRLLELATTTAHQATDFHAFTSALNEQWDHEHKLRVVEAMWDVAYADGELAAHEQHVLWRVADLLHVPHAAYINAKIRAKAAAEQRQG